MLSRPPAFQAPAAARVAVGLRTVAALRGGARVAVRSRSRVAHLYVGPATRTGLGVPRGRRPVCGARTRRLVLAETLPPGRRFCRRCTGLLPVALGRATAVPVTQDDYADVFAHLTVDDLALAGAWARTVDETYEVGNVLTLVHGYAMAGHLGQVHDQLNRRRRDLANRERTPEERDAAAARAAQRIEDDARALAAARLGSGRARALDRQNRGAYLTPRERQLI